MGLATRDDSDAWDEQVRGVICGRCHRIFHTDACPRCDVQVEPSVTPPVPVKREQVEQEQR